MKSISIKDSIQPDVIFKWVLLGGLIFNTLLFAETYNPPERIRVVNPDIEGTIQRPLRYHPEHTDFVIHNGTELFNRPLYGGNTAFRIDASDVPEMSFYLPRHGGNIRFGIKTDKGAKWLNSAENIMARYRPGSMIYEITDPLLGDAVFELTVLGLYSSEGLIAKARLKGQCLQVELVIAFGGIGGRKGKRNGDIGCESEPVSQFFQLKPEYCKDNTITLKNNAFSVESKFADFLGVISQEARVSIADANHWNSFEQLLASTGKETNLPLTLTRTGLLPHTPVYFVLQRYNDQSPSLNADQLEALFYSCEKQRQQIAEHVKVETPDPFINAAVSALCVAADAIWDEQQGSVMHGAVAWRSKYLGWRGPYANDAFGRHDHSKRHLTYWAGQQNTKPVPPAILPADPAANLARNEPSLHSNGDMAGRHYDMNMVYMDALFRHILWTGDLDLARELWPVIERHMAWERRLFRRPFGPDQLPLYEAYAAIWASDDLQYHGGGVTHASAYNYYHNRMVARLAELLGKDGSSYKQEADLILKGMRQYLWLADRGWYGEWKDLLGLQAVHPNAALWTFYHTMDSEVPTPHEAWQMTRFVDTQIPQIPVTGPGVPEGQYFTMPTTTWMPYTWSTNNVVMAEVAHTALAYWQAGRPDKAYTLFKSCILDSMYMGTCPGNAGMTSFYDMARGEAQRDFGDAIGISSRAVVEGLFGIKPDVLKAELTIRPGFPEDWNYAGIQHPDVAFAYESGNNREQYVIKPAFSKRMSLHMILKAKRTGIDKLTINGNSVKWNPVKEAVGLPCIEFSSDVADEYKVQITWKEQEPEEPQSSNIITKAKPFEVNYTDAVLSQIYDPQNVFSEIEQKQDHFKGTVAGTFGHHTVFVGLEQGQMQWYQPIDFELRKPYEVVPSKQQNADSIQFQIENNTPSKIKETVSVDCNRQLKQVQVNIPPYGRSEQIILSIKDFALLPGSNKVGISVGKDRITEGVITNWNISADTGKIQWDTLNLDSVYNDKVTRIFQNEYLAPRSPYCSLAIPKQGIGSWCDFSRTFEVDDSGFRQKARENNNIFTLPQGVPFKTSGLPEAKNIVFTSRWDNYPHEASIRLEGKASHLYLLMAGSTNSMQSRFDNGQVMVTYKDGSSERLALENPATWWPINQNYFIDDYAFRRPEPVPPRVYLKNGQVHTFSLPDFKGKGGSVSGGAATVLDIPLDSQKELQSLTVRTLANEVIIGLMSATLVR